MGDESDRVRAGGEAVRSESGPSGSDRAATIDDVARRAGVHRSTVSRALHRPDLVATPTRQRVQDAAQELGYRPNLVARSLSMGRTGLLALIVPDSANLFFAEFVKATQQHASARDLSVIVAGTGRDAALELQLVRSLSGHVDGLIAMSPLVGADALRSEAGGTPLVVVSPDGDVRTDLLIDDAILACIPLDHLYSLGHRSFAVVAGPKRLPATDQRIISALDWAAGHPDVVVEIVQGIGDTVEEGLLASDSARDWMQRGITGVTTFCDATALGLLMGLTTRRIAVPRDLSVVGSDNVAFAGVIPGGLTTMDLGTDALGRAAVDLVLRSAGPDAEAPPLRLAEPFLVVRGSTGPPRPVS